MFNKNYDKEIEVLKKRMDKIVEMISDQNKIIRDTEKSNLEFFTAIKNTQKSHKKAIMELSKR